MAAVTGGAAIERLLANVKPEERIQEIREELPQARGAKRTALNKEIKYLLALQKNGVKPQEAFVIRKLPVLPAAMRPVYADDRGTLISSDLNELYRDVGAVNDQIKQSKNLPEKHKGDLRRDLYQGIAAAQGLADPISDNKELKGIFGQISGKSSPKGGHFQARVIRSRQNVSGRSTITLGNDLKVDQVGLPEEMAWTLYRDFAVREMVGLGYTKSAALEAIRDRTTVAKTALETAMSKRPAWINRSPSLHRHSIMAMEPVLTPGRAIRINPLITKGFNADFDGDTMSVHVPVSHEAVEEMKGKKPSDVLFAAGRDKLMMVPSQSSALGLYLLSKPMKGARAKAFGSPEAAEKAVNDGTLDPEAPITIRGKKTTGGRLMINKLLPSSHADRYDVLDKKGLDDLLADVARKQPSSYGTVAHKLRALGDVHATQRGFSLGLDDLMPMTKLRDKHLNKAARQAARTRTEKGFVDAYGKASDDIEKELVAADDDGKNTIRTMMIAGSRGSPAQARQIFTSPVIAQDPSGKVVPVPITNSYSEGLDTAEYFSASFGARAGAVGRSHQTRMPGALAKEVLSSVSDAVVAKAKDKDMPSIELSPDDPSDVLGRFLAQDLKNTRGKTILKKNALITPQALAEAKKGKVKTMSVYTPLNATLAGGGLPAMAYGVDATGKVPEVGTNLGVLSGHAMTEPISQMTLDAFHSGATGGTRGRISKFDRIKQLFNLPEQLPHKATLSYTEGKVQDIKKSSAGGWDVYVGANRQRHYVDPVNALTVKKGATLHVGDRLSAGPIAPQELAQLKGLPAAQAYMVDEIKKETGVNRRDAEVVVGAMTDHSQVAEADALDDLLPGDVVPNWKAQKKRTKAIAPKLGTGRRLASPAGRLKPGHTLTKQNIQALEKAGVDSIDIELAKPKVEPIIRGTNMLPLVKAESDWMAGMGFRRLKDVIGEGALRGRSTDIHSYNPIPALAYGAEFGLGEHGQY